MDSILFALVSLEQAFALIFEWQRVLFLITGVILGLSVGVFPGLGGIAGLSLVLPFVYGMDPVSGLALMIGLIAVIPTSDTFASVLLGIPGSSASQATVLDGFPLAKTGAAARALAAAFVSSLFGGLFGATILTFFILIARPLVLAFGLPEMLMITLFGLSMVAVLAGQSLLKGIVAAGAGLLVGTIGAADAAGSGRLSSFDTPYLYDGFTLVIVGLGLFAVPEIIALLRYTNTISDRALLGHGWLQGLRDWWHNLFLSVRCAVIGVIVGVIPGLGGSVVDWIAYGHTVQTSRDKSAFGQGDIRGVIGPESSNNAKEGGGLVPTLIFGIPGSGSMAVFIGAMALLGIDAGPALITRDLDITYTIVWSLALANVVGAGLCIVLSPWIARLTTVPFVLLAPFLFMLISFAAFQSRQSFGDLVALFGFGLLGVFLRRFAWSRPAFLIGFVLSTQAENYTYQAYQVATAKFKIGMTEGFHYIFTPIVLVLIVLTIVSVWVGVKQGRQIRVETMRAGDYTNTNAIETKPRMRIQNPAFVFALVLAVYALVSLLDAWSIQTLTDMIFPFSVAAVTLLMCAIIIVRMVLFPFDSVLFTDSEKTKDEAIAEHGLWTTLAWFAALLVLSALVGFILALAVFFVAFLRWRGTLPWVRAILLSACGLVFILFMARVLNRDFPPGLLQMWFDLPWPLT